MREYARIENGVVREKITLPDAADIAKRYHPSLIWVETTGLTPQPQERWLYDGMTFTAPPPPPPPPPDPTIALDAAINGAATLTALKAALRGRVAAR